MLTFDSLRDPKVIALLQEGAVGVLPTDTIYGLCAAAADHKAVARLYALKNREQKPGTLIAANIEQLIKLGVDEQSLRAVAHLWPNALSIIIPAPDNLAYLHLDLDSLAVRIPKDEDFRTLLEATGILVTSSANHPGEPPAHNLEDAEHYFGDNVDFYVEGGDRSGRPASTVARYANGRLEVLRPGAVPIADGPIEPLPNDALQKKLP